MDIDKYILEPFLHFKGHSIYNPLTERKLDSKFSEYSVIKEIYNQASLDKSKNELKEFEKLRDEGWLIHKSTDVLSRFNLKVVTLEGSAHCNQRCNFCPVSKSPKPVQTMPLSQYENIVEQLSEFKSTIQAVFVMSYNEPTLDKYFIDRIKILKKYDLPVCLNTNATGLNKSKVDQLLDLGILRFLSINLSSLDKEYYAEERKYQNLGGVLKNLDYVKEKKVAQEMVIAVLGEEDRKHKKNFEQIQRKYKDSNFEVRSQRITNRAGLVDKGIRVDKPIQSLAGCDLLGSRPIQHLHINSYGKCFICCQDYYERYIVGDLSEETVLDVLEGEKMKQLRAWTYGLQEAPNDYICRSCNFALKCQKKPVGRKNNNFFST